MKKILNIMLLGLMAISVVVLVLIATLGESTEYQGVGLALTWTYILLGMAILAAVVLPLVNLAQNPKGAMKSLIGVGAVVVVVGIAFAMSSTDPITLGDGETYTNALGLRLSDAGLYTTYFALAAAIVVTIFGEIRNSLK